MRVLFAVRDDLWTNSGGDSVQIRNTAQALRAQGVTVEISSRIDPAWRTFDLIHLWHLERVHETYARFLHARQIDKPIVLSPIYWPKAGDARPGRPPSLVENGKNMARWLFASSMQNRRQVGMALRHGWSRCRREILCAAGAILTNSVAEKEVIEREFGVDRPCRVVPNGVDRAACENEMRRPSGRRAGVLCVGHFDLRKNQLLLIRALRGLDVPVTFIGTGRPWHRMYYRCCQMWAGGRMQFLGALRHAQVLDRMRQALVHVCPSHFETPGLVNLEAGVMGCRLAIADCPPVREYFGAHALYFSSHSVDALRETVLKALATPAGPGLTESILSNFTWEAAARQTFLAYEEALQTHESAFAPEPMGTV